MYASVCWAYRWVEIAVKPQVPCHFAARVRRRCVSITLADDQLRQIEAAITERLDARAAEQTKEATAATVAE